MGRNRSTIQSGTDELSIQHAILELMLDGKVWSNAELKARLGKALELSGEDRMVGARVNEALWENRINNALSPSRASSLTSKGHVVRRGRGVYSISDQGRSFITGNVDIHSIEI